MTGMTCWYQRFLPNYAEICEHLYRLKYICHFAYYLCTYVHDSTRKTTAELYWGRKFITPFEQWRALFWKIYGKCRSDHYRGSERAKKAQEKELRFYNQRRCFDKIKFCQQLLVHEYVLISAPLEVLAKVPGPLPRDRCLLTKSRIRKRRGTHHRESWTGAFVLRSRKFVNWRQDAMNPYHASFVSVLFDFQLWWSSYVHTCVSIAFRHSL